MYHHDRNVTVICTTCSWAEWRKSVALPRGVVPEAAEMLGSASYEHRGRLTADALRRHDRVHRSPRDPVGPDHRLLERVPLAVGATDPQ